MWASVRKAFNRPAKDVNRESLKPDVLLAAMGGGIKKGGKGSRGGRGSGLRSRGGRGGGRGGQASLAGGIVYDPADPVTVSVVREAFSCVDL
jgi:hypothetical protein